MKYPNTLVLGKTTRVFIPETSLQGGFPEKSWIVVANGYHQSWSNPDGYNVSFVGDATVNVSGVPTQGVILDVYIIPNAVPVGDQIYVQFFYTGPPYTAQYGYQLHFDASCMNVSVAVSKVTPDSPPVPGAGPQKYVHRYSVSASTLGGTPPLNYAWSTTVSGGVLVDFSATGDSCILEVTNTTPTFSGITGEVTCAVTDSSGCPASGKADVAEATPPPCQCVSAGPNGAASVCSCQTCPPEQCKQSSGNHLVGPGNPDKYRTYAGSAGMSSTPMTMGRAY